MRISFGAAIRNDELPNVLEMPICVSVCVADA